MGRPRKTISEIEVAGNPGRLNALQLAQRREEANAPLTQEQRTELQRLDELIANAMHACQRGQTVRGKRNPAFANLALLMKLRSHVLTQKRPPKSAEDVIAEADQILGLNPKEIN